MGGAILRAARPEEGELLTELALRSKAHWGYDAEFIRACRPSLTITPQKIATNPYYVVEESGGVVGFYGLKPSSDGEVELDYLFIDPPGMGKGHGRMLFEHAVATARGQGYARMSIESEPYAEEFYARMGAVCVGRRESTAKPGRFLPLLSLRLTP
ncbi:GNAT family N-acetyltransferase [Polyangium aurulentum]|uniref:GNAT family N-acetyltransferase n=1 Tax=Polyangium aurulentum TaxID=2567896 RepID=UPI001980CCAC|nr:GNAT family N-acetyltransferase [Polyangium aurulentum]UQA56492.1 GNAT family N-acetyltransferase [Polyangium aurulentum]